MKRRFLLWAGALVLLAGVASAESSWVAQYTGLPAGTVTTDFRFAAVSEDVCWAVNHADNTSTNQYIRTTDGGAHWTVGTVGEAPAAWRGSYVAAYDADTAWIVMHDRSGVGPGGVFKTTNGGTSWTRQVTAFPGPRGNPKTIHFFDAKNGVCIGDPNPANDWEIYTTSDGGTLWTRVHINAEANEVTFYSLPAFSNHVWFSSGIGGPSDWRLYHSTDRGVTWTMRHLTGNVSIPAFTDSLHGVMGRTDHEQYVMLRTTDGGMSWASGPDFPPYGFVYAVPGTPGMYVRCNFVIPSIGGMPGSSYSTDGGATWTVIDMSLQRGFASFASAGAGWCGSANDSVYKWTGITLASTRIPTDGLQLWLRADTGVTMNGSTVSRWVDQSGHGHDALQNDKARQPTVAASAIAGRPAMHFNGYMDKLGLTGTARMSRMSLFIAFRHQSGGDVITFGAPGDFAPGHQFFFIARGLDDLSDRIGLGFSRNSGIRAVADNIGARGEWRNVSVVTDSAIFNTTLRWNGHNATMVPIGENALIAFPLGNVDGTGGGIGGADGMPDGTLEAACDVAEVLVYNTAVSDSVRAAVEKYLGEKYSIATSVAEEAGKGIPAAFSLSQNYPNPFNPSTVIRFSIPAGVSGNVSLQVFDLVGREVRTLVNGNLPPGTYNATFDATGLASGAYFYRLTAGNFVQTKRLLFVQ